MKKELKYPPQEFRQILDELIEELNKLPERDRPLIVTIPGTDIAFFNTH